QRHRVHTAPRGGKLFSPAREIEAFCTREESPAVSDRDDPNIKPLLTKIATLIVQLLDQRTADRADADDDQGQLFPFLEEFLVDDVQSAILFGRVNHP